MGKASFEWVYRSMRCGTNRVTSIGNPPQYRLKMNSPDTVRGSTVTIHLVAYANPQSHALSTSRQAQSVITTLSRKTANWIDLDFSGVDSVSSTFADEVFGFAEREMEGVWLIPTHYSLKIRPFLNHQLSVLQQRREQMWRAASISIEIAGYSASMPDETH